MDTGRFEAIIDHIVSSGPILEGLPATQGFASTACRAGVAVAEFLIQCQGRMQRFDDVMVIEASVLLTCMFSACVCLPCTRKKSLAQGGQQLINMSAEACRPIHPRNVTSRMLTRASIR